MHIKILWVVLIVSNLSWFVAYRFADKGRVSEASQIREFRQRSYSSCQCQLFTGGNDGLVANL